jgi:glycosyltransferase involved in cell wall biosynthesis
VLSAESQEPRAGEMGAPESARAVPGPRRPVRVARIIARLNIGGPAQQAILLTAGLDRTRFTSTLITGRPGPEEGDLGGLAETRGVTPTIIAELGRAVRPGRDLVALLRLVRLFRCIRPDIVHTHTAKAGTLGRIAAQIVGGAATVHTFHGHVLDGYFSAPVTRLFLNIERFLGRRTDRLVTLSPRLRDALVELGIGRPEQVAIIPLGLELDRFAGPRDGGGALRDALAVPTHAMLLASIGRLVPIKDHATLLQAIARLIPPSAHLLIVGDGEARGSLERLTTQLGLADRVHFLGWRSDLETILGATDVVISASRNEGTPVALIEAMAAGVPVVATAVGGVPDLVEHGVTGWLVPANDADALAGGIRHLIEAPELRARLARAARPHAIERYGAAHLIRRIEQLYTSVLADRKGRLCACS